MLFHGRRHHDHPSPAVARADLEHVAVVVPQLQRGRGHGDDVLPVGVERAAHGPGVEGGGRADMTGGRRTPPVRAHDDPGLLRPPRALDPGDMVTVPAQGPHRAAFPDLGPMPARGAQQDPAEGLPAYAQVVVVRRAGQHGRAVIAALDLQVPAPQRWRAGGEHLVQHAEPVQEGQRRRAEEVGGDGRGGQAGAVAQQHPQTLPREQGGARGPGDAAPDHDHVIHRPLLASCPTGQHERHAARPDPAHGPPAVADRAEAAAEHLTQVQGDRTLPEDPGHPSVPD